MEPRIAALESQIEYIKGRLDSLFTSVEATRQDIGKLREDVATLKEGMLISQGKNLSL
jgi:uncharacterized coiled-coil protein SlyX